MMPNTTPTVMAFRLMSAPKAVPPSTAPMIVIVTGRWHGQKMNDHMSQRRPRRSDSFATTGVVIAAVSRDMSAKSFTPSLRHSRPLLEWARPARHKVNGVPLHEEDSQMAGKFELYKDRAGRFRIRLKASNGQTIASGEAYNTKASALKGIESIRKNALEARLDDQT